MHIILVLPNNCRSQTMSSVSRRDASLDVQRPLRNEQGDNFDLEQSKKNTISTFLLFLHAQKWVAGVDECRIEADACHALPIWRLQPGLQKPIDEISDGSAPPAFFAWFEIAQWLATLYWRFALICKRRSAIGRRSRFFVFFSFSFFLYCRSHNESGPNPLPPIWKFFRLSAMCELLRWPLSSFSNLHQANFIFKLCNVHFTFGCGCTVHLLLALAKISLQPRKSWGCFTVRSCDSVPYRALVWHRCDPQYLRVASSRCRSDHCFMISHDRTVDQSHEDLGCNDFLARVAASLQCIHTNCMGHTSPKLHALMCVPVIRKQLIIHTYHDNLKQNKIKMQRPKLTQTDTKKHTHKTGKFQCTNATTTLAKKNRPLGLCIKSEHCSYHGISKNQAWFRFGAATRQVVASRATAPISR